MEKDNRLQRIIDEIELSIVALDESDEVQFGEKLAYIECLEIIKTEIAGEEAQYGLDGDLEKKFHLAGQK